jgi:hypothetical protein
MDADLGNDRDDGRNSDDDNGLSQSAHPMRAYVVATITAAALVLPTIAFSAEVDVGPGVHSCVAYPICFDAIAKRLFCSKEPRSECHV